jgi:four helix bundle protein
MQFANCSKPWKLGAAMKGEELLERFVRFAAEVGRVVDELPDTRRGRHIAGQLVRCGTSPAPNYAEACAAESRADFVHKLSVVLKELRETRTWLRIIVHAGLLNDAQTQRVARECQELSNIVGASIATCKAAIAREKRKTTENAATG